MKMGTQASCIVEVQCTGQVWLGEDVYVVVTTAQSDSGRQFATLSLSVKRGSRHRQGFVETLGAGEEIEHPSIGRLTVVAVNPPRGEMRRISDESVAVLCFEPAEGFATNEDLTR